MKNYAYNSKEDFKNLLFDILDPLRSRYTEGCANIDLKGHATWYDDGAVAVEAFSRPLWGLVPFWAGGGSDAEFEKIYRTGLSSGSDKSNGEYWGDCHDRDQRFVEMAAIAYGMIFAPDKVWTLLTDVQKDNLVSWLSQINTHDVCDSNWIFFRILTNVALKKAGREYSQARLDADLKRIDDFYLGGGWYADGAKGQKDYYIAFAIHFYGLIYAVAMADDEPKRAAEFKRRAEAFAHDFIYWFSEDGEALPYGRSLTYRFAQVAFWSACVIADVRPFSLGVMKGIIARNLQKWFESEMFDNGHILSVGYKYPNLLMAEHYNAPGSPYWGLKAFALLMLPDEHEFWTTPASPLPKLDKIKTIKKADMLVTRRNGDITAYVVGTHGEFGCGQIPQKYLKFAYSTKFGFSASYSNLSLEEAACDSELCFVVDGLVLTRRHNISGEVKDDRIITRWSPFEGIEVETTIIPKEYGHCRIHKIKSSIECAAFDCGFSVEQTTNGADRCADKNGAAASGGDLKCGVQAVSGSVTGARVILASPNTNLIYKRTAIPAVEYKIEMGENEIVTDIFCGISKAALERENVLK